MARGPTTDEQELPAYPIRAYQLIPDPNQPTVVALAIETDQGHSLFLATRQILEDLGKDLLERAAKMPPRRWPGWHRSGRERWRPDRFATGPVPSGSPFRQIDA